MTETVQVDTASSTADIEEAQSARAMRQIQWCLVILFLFLILSLLSGHVFWILISLYLFLSVSSSYQEQAEQEQHRRHVATNMVGTVRVVPTYPERLNGAAPVAGSVEAYPVNMMRVQLQNGQVFNLPVTSQLGDRFGSPQNHVVEITDPQTGAVIHTTATAAIPILTSDTSASRGAGGAQLPASSAAAHATTTTTWMQDYEAAKERHGAQDEADALYGRGAEYSTAGPAEHTTTSVEVHDEVGEEEDATKPNKNVNAS